MDVSNKLMSQMYSLLAQSAIEDLKDKKDAVLERNAQKKEVRAALQQSKMARQAMQNVEGGTPDADARAGANALYDLEKTLQSGSFEHTDVAEAAELEDVGNKGFKDTNNDGKKDLYVMHTDESKEEWGKKLDLIDDALKARLEELNDLSQIEQMEINSAMKRHDRAMTTWSSAESEGDKTQGAIARNISG